MAGVLRWIFGKCDESNSNDQFGVEEQKIKSKNAESRKKETKKSDVDYSTDSSADSDCKHKRSSPKRHRVCKL